MSVLKISAKMFRSIYFHKKIISAFSTVGSSCVMMHLYNRNFHEFHAETNMILYQIEMHFIFLLGVIKMLNIKVNEIEIFLLVCSEHTMM